MSRRAWSWAVFVAVLVVLALFMLDLGAPLHI